MKNHEKKLIGYMVFFTALFAAYQTFSATQTGANKENMISRQSVRKSIDDVYDNVMFELKNEGFSIVKEINIGHNLKKDSIEKKWKNYNKNKLVGIRTAIVCSGVTANSISNADPNMISICPLHVTITQKGEWTKVDFVRPSMIAKGTRAEKVAVKLENRLNSAIHKGLFSWESPR